MRSRLLKSYIPSIFRVPGSQTPKEEGLNQPPTREGRTDSPQKRVKRKFKKKITTKTTIMVLAKRPRQITVLDQNVY